MFEQSLSERWQRGAIDLVVIFAVLFGALVVTFAIKVVPVYLDHWAIEEALQAVVDEGNSMANASDRKLKRLLNRRLEVNRIEFLSADDLEFSRSADGLVGELDYERRVSMFSNIDIVVRFPATRVVAGGG